VQRSPRTKLMVVLIITGVVLWVGGTGFIRGRELQRRLICAKNVKGLGTSLRIYRSDHHDVDPTIPPIEWLMAKGYVSHQQCICPSSTPSTSNYIVVPFDPSHPGDERAVVLYEPKSNHGGEGGNVLFADGHVSFVRGRDYDDLIVSRSNTAP